MDFGDIANNIDQWVADGAVPGASIVIEHRGHIVASHQAGEAAPGRPMAPDTMSARASVSKPLTAAAVMRVVDQGLFSLDDSVSSILPEFSAPDDPFADDALPQLEAQRDDITIRQLLAHTSGEPENAGIKRIRATTMPTMDEQVDIMLQVPL
ncbi:MAG TPA: serine hydrolase domain-containing protein, partial [Thermomicrobiales bacterium]|nr:serine hydrolase domain-containing protein [Thermomicrobiales bacterium]